MPKSIMKSEQTSGEPGDDGKKNYKRNKSVTFSFGDETVSKKTKTDVLPPQEHGHHKAQSKHKKNNVLKDDKAREGSFDHGSVSSKSQSTSTGAKKKHKATSSGSDEGKSDLGAVNFEIGEASTKKIKHDKKNKVPVNVHEFPDDGVSGEKQNMWKQDEHLPKKDVNKADKKRGQSLNEDLAEGLGNLYLGEGACSLALLLDEARVVDRKVRPKLVKQKATVAAPEAPLSDEADVENIVKWTKKRWNKDRKGVSALKALKCSVVVDNLPTNIMSVYQKRLTEYFKSCGRIKRFSGAEHYTSELGQLVFMTKIYFDSEEAATMALAKDKSFYAGSEIRVRRPLSPNETTCVARCYADITEKQAIAIFSVAGAPRTVRVLPRRGSGMAVAFIEYEGPEAVEWHFRRLKVGTFAASKSALSPPQSLHFRRLKVGTFAGPKSALSPAQSRHFRRFKVSTFAVEPYDALAGVSTGLTARAFICFIVQVRYVLQ